MYQDNIIGKEIVNKIEYRIVFIETSSAMQLKRASLASLAPKVRR